MKKLLFFAATAFALAACTKDKFETIPQINIDSFGPSEVTKGQVIRLIATVTDKEGDVQDSVVFRRKIYSVTTGNHLTTDSIVNNLKDIGVPSKNKFELQLSLVYGEINEAIGPIQNNGSGVDRHLSIEVYIKDKAGNRSTTVETDKILLKKI